MIYRQRGSQRAREARELLLDRCSNQRGIQADAAALFFRRLLEIVIRTAANRVRQWFALLIVPR